MSISRTHSLHRIHSRENGMRLDHYLALHFPEHSRSSLGKYILSAHILVNDRAVKAGCRLHPGDVVQVDFSLLTEENQPQAQPVDFEVLHEDPSLVVINKPPGLVVHPAAGHADQTLVNGLLYRYADMAALEGGRPGIVHRLDKDTSGIMLVARTEKVQAMLSAAFKERKVRKTYHALLLRSPADGSGRIVAPVGRHPVHRKKMAVRPDAVMRQQFGTSWKAFTTASALQR
ncbi:pseudouridine synthase, RluA family [Candidatus Electrothrix marina]|uniref:Pseudouridine synthase, RluA family n=1 Tax=Candidatus Electrothrix marina TaxID=1859130 RepID=A0A444J1X8_9BACT|nr:pseudouridine synthase, RluA family [Candidatus Electrothrix marina]